MKNFITANNKYKKSYQKYLKFETKNMQPNIKIFWKKASGFEIQDKFNKKYIDFTSGIFASNIGYKNKILEKYVKTAIDSGICHTYNYYNFYRERYSQELINFVGSKKLKKCFLVSSGTEATEAALKFARLYGTKINKKKTGIICLKGNWHGRTVGSQMLSGKNDQSKWIGFFDKNIFHIKFPYPWEVKNTDAKNFFHDSLKDVFKAKFNFKEKIAAIMLETFQGWGAVFYPPEFVQALSEFAKERDILVTFDEMQSGFGRTGKLFGYMHYGVEPDLLCCGKGASSGFPLALVLGSAEVLDIPDIGSMSSTHSANPIVCAAGKANLECLFDDRLIEASRNLGVTFHEELEKIRCRFAEYLSWVEGKGLLAALIFKDQNGNPLASLCDAIAELCMQSGLLVVHTGRESIKLAPPLSISKEAMLEGLSVLEQSIAVSISESKL